MPDPLLPGESLVLKSHQHWVVMVRPLLLPVALVVDVNGTPGSEIENAFVILMIERGEERWRILARVRVPLDGAGRPQPRVETMTTQRVGFSGEL